MELNMLAGGAYEVLLGGVLWDNCTTDADCPGRARCARNASWAAHPAMCFCSFRYDQIGSECGELGEYGMMYVVMSILLGAISAFVGILGIRNLVILVRLKRFKADAVTTSLSFALMANLCSAWLLPTLASYNLRTPGPRAEDGEKVSPNTAGQVSLALTFFFTTLSLLNISLVWIEIADSASTLKNSSGNIQRYRNVLIVYYVIFSAVVLASLVLDRFIIQAALIVPAITFVIISYVIGFFRMRSALKTLISSKQDPGSVTESRRSKDFSKTAESSTNTKYQRNLKLIQESAVGISVSCFILIISFGVYLGIGSSSGEVPRALYNAIPLIITYSFMVLADIFVMRYLTILIEWKRSATTNISADGVSKSSLHNRSGAAILATTSPVSDLERHNVSMTS